MTNERTHGPTSAARDGFRLWMVPYLSNPHFVGRERALAELSAWFTPGEFKALALLGLAGVGKTQLAVEYAYRCESDYDAVFWVTAETLVMLRANLATLAGPRALDLSPLSDPSEVAQIAAVLDWLRVHDRWLLICDDAGTVAAEGLMELLQDVPHGHVLFTSRRVDWPIALADLTLERFPVDVAVEFLQRRTLGRNAGRDAAAAELGRELAGSPLLLEQAGAFLESRRIGYEAYLAKVRAADSSRSTFDESAEYREPLPVTWLISESELAPPARAILRIASFFARAPLPRDLFEGRAELIRKAAGLLAADGIAPTARDLATIGLEQLARFGLIELTLSSVSWRQSLRLARDAIPAAERGSWLGFALRAFEHIIAEPAQLELLQAHALSLLEATDDVSLQPRAARLYSALGSFLAAQGRYHEAEPLLRSALVLHEEAQASDDPALPSHRQRLAEVLIAMGRTEEAAPFTARALPGPLADVQGHA